MMKTSLKTIANRCLDHGFDRTYIRGGAVHPQCSQCEAVCINGHACHEHGCPNKTHECTGCNAVIPVNNRYCSDCA